MEFSMISTVFIIVIISLLFMQAKQQDCDSGMFNILSNLECEICEQGYFCPGDDEAYTCSPGSYADTSGLSECLACAVNTYAPLTGASECLACENDEYALPGASQCTACDVSDPIEVTDPSLFDDTSYEQIWSNNEFIQKIRIPKGVWTSQPDEVGVSVNNTKADGVEYIFDSGSDTIQIHRDSENYDTIQITLYPECFDPFTFVFEVVECFRGCSSCIAENLCDFCQSTGYFMDGNNCLPCPLGCNLCIGSDQCSECTEGYYFFDSGCLEICPDGFYADIESLQCKRCDDSCETCYGPSNDQCYSCQGTKVLVSYVCTDRLLSIVTDIGYISAGIAIGVGLISLGISATFGTTTSVGGGAAISTQSQGVSSSVINGVSSAQLFWILLNYYQMIEVFLLLDVKFHETMIELLEAVNYSTFNLALIPIPFIEDFQNKIQGWSDPNKSTLLAKRMEKAGFHESVFIADYLYLMIVVCAFVIFHLLFVSFIAVPKNPKTTIQKIVYTWNLRFHYRFYLRTCLEVYLFMLLAAISEFRNNHTTAVAIISLLCAIIWCIFLLVFTVFVFGHYILYSKDLSKVSSRALVLYAGVKDTSIAKFYTCTFLLRWLPLVFILSFLHDPIPQLCLVIIIQFLAFLYIGLIRPFKMVQDNLVAFLGELCILICYFIFTTLRKDVDLSDSEVEARTQTAIYVITIVTFATMMIAIIFFIFDVAMYVKRLKASYDERRYRDFNDAREISITDLKLSDDKKRDVDSSQSDQDLLK